MAPALLHGGATYRVEEISADTGLSHKRVHDSLDLLFERGVCGMRVPHRTAARSAYCRSGQVT
ncbi:hypothetical protein QF032_004089 [Streptomyces achromogenes]|nr:hypothetical protein [Streptomyces achromogenes]